MHEFARLAIGTFARQARELAERAGVGEKSQALAHGEFAVQVLPGDALFAAHLEGERAPPFEFFDFRNG